jgi:hypothetical protein
MKSFFRLGAAALLAAVVCAVGPLATARAQAPNLAGSYLLDDPTAVPDIKKAVDKVADQMGFFAASVARDRLIAANKPAGMIVIAMAGNEVTTRFDQDQPIRTPADGSTIDWTRDDGEKVKVTTSWMGATLKRAVAGKDATRTTSFSLDASGKVLTLQIQITSEHLPQPLAYQLTYRRNG